MKDVNSLAVTLVKQEDNTVLVLFQGKVIADFSSEEEAELEYSFAKYAATNKALPEKVYEY